MFVQSARFVQNYRHDPNAEISIYGQEKRQETVRICKMNLAVHGLAGDIREANTYYDNAHDVIGRFDFVMANPPFNVDKVDKPKLRATRATPSACPAWTTLTTSGYRSSLPRSPTMAAPDS